MFGFESEILNNTHEQRKVATYDKDGVFVDTCAVNDSDQPYETAIAHPKFNDGVMIIVQLYDTKEAAQNGHNKWVKKMTAKVLPKAIKDVSTADVIDFARIFGVDLNEIHPENPA